MFSLIKCKISILSQIPETFNELKVNDHIQITVCHIGVNSSSRVTCVIIMINVAWFQRAWKI